MKRNLLKKKLVLLLFLSLNILSTSLYATENINTDQLKDSLPNDCVFSGNFTQSRKIKALPQPLLSSGKLFFSCQHGLIWHNEAPFPESLIYTAKGLHFRKTPEDGPIELNNQQHYYLAKFLINLLSADIAKIEKDFSINFNKQDTGKIIELLPTNSFIKKGLNSILIKKVIERQEETLSITINNTKEQITTLSIANLTAYTNNEQSEVSTKCNRALPNNSACSVLATPQHYQTTDSN